MDMFVCNYEIGTLILLYVSFPLEFKFLFLYNCDDNKNVFWGASS